MTTSGLRELKKQRTRLALIDAALDLFLRRGYEQTTIDEIVAAVEVSQRTFFRYFATKEDVVLGVMDAFDQSMVELLRELPDSLPPTRTLVEAMRGVLDVIRDGDAVEHERQRRIREVIETTPTLIAAHLARQNTSLAVLTDEIARRMGVDPEADMRPALLVAIFQGATRVGFEQCASRQEFDPYKVVSRVEESVSLAMGALREDWATSRG
ncbi:TetR family transcriptional regulator [Actinocorallia longicatena]|uniref:HTH tetR-type domain-containing protein n=1 Tax=Actinocorallia longicatena TaxID=111803 RepID=A0ABP6QM89_9ACTN